MPAAHDNQESSQESLQSQDWYVIADEGELTLRISHGLRVGEDRWGELTLNHPLSAHRWLEFTIDADGELWCHSSRKDIVVRGNDEILEDVMLDAGVSIALPHNMLHISNHIRRGTGADWQIEVGLLETQDGDNTMRFDDPVDTQADLTAIPEPGASGSIESALDALAIDTHKGVDSKFGNDNRSAADTVVAPNSSANDSAETRIPTLETVVAAPRPIASGEAGPAIERAVAKLKNRNQMSHADSTESALIPVDADGPFHTDEIRAALQQPINVGEPGQHSQAPRGVQGNRPIYTPSVTTSIVAAVPRARLRLIAGVAIGLLVLVGAALLAAINAAPDDEQQRSLTGRDNSTSQPSSVTPATPQASVVPTQPVSSTSRTSSLLKTASALLSKPADLQPDTLDFAIRSLNLVLAAQPQNLEAQRLLASAEQIRIERNRPVVTVPKREIDNTPQVATSPPPSDTITSSTTSSSPGTRSSITTSAFSYTDPRLAKAAELIAQGAILSPRQNSAVTLIMSVLAEDPNSQEAVRLLNRSASVLVAQADEEYETLGVYAARNTLEEVLSFHPKHGPANQRWRTWVARDSSLNNATPTDPSIGSDLEPQAGFSLEDRP